MCLQYIRFSYTNNICMCICRFVWVSAYSNSQLCGVWPRTSLTRSMMCMCTFLKLKLLIECILEKRAKTTKWKWERRNKTNNGTRRKIFNDFCSSHSSANIDDDISCCFLWYQWEGGGDDETESFINSALWLRSHFVFMAQYQHYDTYRAYLMYTLLHRDICISLEKKVREKNTW